MIKQFGVHMFFSIKGGACLVMRDKNWSDEENKFGGQHQWKGFDVFVLKGASS